MAFLEQTYSVEDLPVSINNNFEPLPEGWYTAAISGAEIKTTKGSIVIRRMPMAFQFFYMHLKFFHNSIATHRLFHGSHSN